MPKIFPGIKERGLPANAWTAWEEESARKKREPMNAHDTERLIEIFRVKEF